MSANRVPPEQRFWPKVDKRSPDECWLWKGSLDSNGYASIYQGKKWLGAHRLSWQMANKRPVPPKLVVCHSCDNPKCVNPNHLWVGTQADNARDMLAKGRGGNQRKTHCKRGHEFTPENTRTSGGVRACRACDRDRQRAISVAQGKGTPNYLKTHCNQGHPLDDGNTFWTADGRRQCRACNTLRARGYRAAKHAGAAA